MDGCVFKISRFKMRKRGQLIQGEGILKEKATGKKGYITALERVGI